ARIQVSAFKAPTVSVEHSAHVSAVSCDSSGKTLFITFTSADAWQTAVDDWSQHRDGFYIVTYVDGCGPGVASGKQSFHLVHGFTSDRSALTITCKMETTQFHDAVHPDENVSLEM
ncbi:hypothetical protein GGX14DRAFT_314201, partial [Mycena pura]